MSVIATVEGQEGEQKHRFLFFLAKPKGDARFSVRERPRQNPHEEKQNEAARHLGGNPVSRRSRIFTGKPNHGEPESAEGVRENPPLLRVRDQTDYRNKSLQRAL